MKISALIVAKNEEQFVRGCIERMYPYVDEIIFVDNASSDNTRSRIENLELPKVKVFSYPETDNMGELRQFSLDQATGDWIWQVDADEFYEKEDCKKIVEAVNKSTNEISFRVGYHQIAWKKDTKQANFNHYPDRLYRRDVVDRYDGMLPNDMTKVKREFYKHRPFLEYDNPQDKSFENPVQPILPAKYYHLARTRGYSFEFQKWTRYNHITHKDWSVDQCKELAKKNQWVSGLYDLEKIEIPFEIPPIKNPKVSVVITNYNYGRFVDKAIESANNQTVKPYEIIVVDDCSTDDSRKIIEKYDVKKLYQVENKGVVQCRNWGINETTGDFFLLIDADDYIEPTYIEEVLKKQAETNADITYTDIKMFGDVDYIHSYENFTIEGLKRNQNIPSVCALVKRQMFEISGGFGEDTVYDDYEWWMRLCIKHNAVVAQVHEPLFCYNRKQGSRIAELDKRQAEGFAQLSREYGKIL